MRRDLRGTTGRSARGALEGVARLVALYRKRDRENKKLEKLLKAAKQAGSSMGSSDTRGEIEAQRRRVQKLVEQIDELTKLLPGMGPRQKLRKKKGLD